MTDDEKVKLAEELLVFLKKRWPHGIECYCKDCRPIILVDSIKALYSIKGESKVDIDSRQKVWSKFIDSIKEKVQIEILMSNYLEDTND